MECQRQQLVIGTLNLSHEWLSLDYAWVTCTIVPYWWVQ